MEYKFTRSLVVISQLARDAARTPPSDEESPFSYVDQSLTILGRTFDSYNQRMRQEFLGQRDFIATQLKEVEKKIDGRFKEVDGRFEKIDERFDKVEKKIDERFKETEKTMDRRFEESDTKMRGRFVHMQNASRNFLRTRGWEEIYPVGTLDARGGIHTPEHFPRTVRRFWSLKDSSQSKHPGNNMTILRLTLQTVARLIQLIRFYEIQGYEEWGTDADSFEGESDSDESADISSKSSGIPVTLEVAVRLNPEIAHRALAAALGLAYDGIQKFMERAQELSQARAKERSERSKRRHEEEISEERKTRGFKRSVEEEGTEVTSPTEPLSSHGRSR